MPWPKGVKRVGYVKKDGTPHAKRGERKKVREIKEVKLAYITVVKRDEPPYTQTKTDKAPRVEKDKPVLKGQGGRPIIEPCPSCGYAYGDGGWCPDCGVTQPQPTCPHCRRLRERKSK